MANPPGARPIRVLHLITGTGVGGAEGTLAKLVSSLDPKRFENVVYSMIDLGATADTIRKCGVNVHSLGMRRGIPNPAALFSLVREIRRWKPTLIQTWMYHADLMGGIAGKLAGGIPVVWNIRHSDLRPGSDKTLTIRVAQLCASLAFRLPSRIVCCAESSRIIHSRMGYEPSKMVVIPNGFDLGKYRQQPDARAICEERFGIPRDAEVVSLVARYHPQKDHRTFIEAAKLFSTDFPNSYFVMCGDNVTDSNAELAGLVRDAGIAARTLLLGRRPADDIALIMSRSILTTSASRGEGFPNVVGEAMACGTMCVVTDVGDSAYIVGDCGVVVRPGSREALAAGWKKVMDLDAATRQLIGQQARQRIEENFTLQSVVRRYEELYIALAGG